MIKEFNQFLINKNQTQVFDFISNDEHLKKWVNGVVAVKPVGQHNNAVGDTVLIEVNVPKAATIKSTLTAWQPPNHFSTTYSTNGMTGTMTFQLIPVNKDHTQVQFSAVHYPAGFIQKLLQPLIAWIIKKERVKEHLRLKKVLENTQRKKQKNNQQPLK